LGKERILIVDDEKEIRDLIEIYLKNEGYSIFQAENGEDALKILTQHEIDLIILDVMMPKVDGIEACIRIRNEKMMPIIMLSAKNQDIDKITGLSIGADDYMTKPFNPLELVARVKSQLRRYFKLNQQVERKANEIEIDELLIRADTYQVFVRGEEVKLTPREFAILELLAKHPGRVFSIEQIYEKVWNDLFFQSDNTVMVHIRKLREKIEENPSKPRYIKTVWGVGYKIEN
jgi:DNA-binding response OmpR family regulator